MKTKILTCANCGESDYANTMGSIDGRVLCHVCWTAAMDELENEVIKEVTNYGNYCKI